MRQARGTPSRARQGCPPPQPLMTRRRAPGAVAQALTAESEQVAPATPPQAADDGHADWTPRHTTLTPQHVL